MGHRISRKQSGDLTAKIAHVVQQNEQLRGITQKMQDDPLAPFLKQYEAAITQNNKLSALSAALIDREGGKIVISVQAIEAFVGKRLSLHFELDGPTDGPDTNVVFTYSSEKAQAPVVITPEAAAEDQLGEIIEAAQAA